MLEVVDLRPVGVVDAVGNDITLDGRGLVVTGSNMAGKSTFLRTLGVNAILAQSIGVVFGAAYRSTPLQVRSSIHVRDDLARGRSLFRVEAERLLAIWNASRPQEPTLVLLDEPFRGTNPADRVAAAGAFIREIGRHHLVVVATHDEVIVELVRDVADPVHFAEAVDHDAADLVFDYRLRAGSHRHPNALRVLACVGFPESMLDHAQTIASRARLYSPDTSSPSLARQSSAAAPAETETEPERDQGQK